MPNSTWTTEKIEELLAKVPDKALTLHGHTLSHDTHKNGLLIARQVVAEFWGDAGEFYAVAPDIIRSLLAEKKGLKQQVGLHDVAVITLRARNHELEVEHGKIRASVDKLMNSVFVCSRCGSQKK